MIITMTNKSISLLSEMTGKSLEQKIEMTKEIVAIEYKKIIAQANNFKQICNEDKLVNMMLQKNDSEEMFEYLNNLNILEISLLSSYGIEVSFMNVLKVSE